MRGEIRAPSLLKAPAVNDLKSVFALFLVGLFLYQLPAHAAQVFVSDTVVILSENSRSGSIEVSNMNHRAQEFDVVPISLPDEIMKGDRLLRWGPDRLSVPGNRSGSLRFVYRPIANLPAGEYVSRFNVRSTVSGEERSVVPGDAGDVDKAGKDGAGAAVGIQVALPVTIYIRHNVEAPLLDISDFIPTLSDPRSHGFYIVSKKSDGVSFVGGFAVDKKGDGYNQAKGRLFIPQTKSTHTIDVPRKGTEGFLLARHCLKLWDSFPAKGSPNQEQCSGD